MASVCDHAKEANPVPDRYKCNVCFEVMDYPYLMVCCGKKFCGSCLERWFRSKKRKLRCPHCRSSIHRVLEKGLKKEMESVWPTKDNSKEAKCCVEYDGQVHNFVTPLPTRLICKICNNVIKDPHLAICCGEKFCYSCIESLDTKSNKSLSVCPNCRSLLRHVQEKEMKSEVNSLKVCCSNKGCPWRGELSSCVKHHEDCPHRKVHCEYCHIQYKFITYLNHLMECGKMPIACPNNCGEVIFRESMTDHRQECKQELVKCKHELVKCKHSKEGCKKRKDLKKHRKDRSIYKKCQVCKKCIDINESEFHYNSCIETGERFHEDKRRSSTRSTSSHNLQVEKKARQQSSKKYYQRQRRNVPNKAMFWQRMAEDKDFRNRVYSYWGASDDNFTSKNVTIVRRLYDWVKRRYCSILIFVFILLIGFLLLKICF